MLCSWPCSQVSRCGAHGLANIRECKLVCFGGPFSSGWDSVHGGCPARLRGPSTSTLVILLSAVLVPSQYLGWLGRLGLRLRALGRPGMNRPRGRGRAFGRLSHGNLLSELAADHMALTCAASHRSAEVTFQQCGSAPWRMRSPARSGVFVTMRMRGTSLRKSSPSSRVRLATGMRRPGTATSLRSGSQRR